MKPENKIPVLDKISDEMKTDHETFYESEWKATQVNDSKKVTYEPQQDYLK